MRHPDLRLRTPSPMPGLAAVESPARERVLGALTGPALGDALGIPTQSTSLTQIRRRYSEITGLHDAVAEQSIAPSVPAGSVTDDTEQALILAGLLINGGGRIGPRQLADAFLRREDDMCARGSLDLLGPSIKPALERVRVGADPHCIGREGTTNSAAMRVAPVGIAFSPSAGGDALTWVVQASCLVTHDTRQGFEAVGLLTVAVSAAIDGADMVGALEAALDFVTARPEVGYWVERVSVAARTRLALETSRDLHGETLAEHLRTHMGTSVESAKSVLCALVIMWEFAQRPLDELCFATEFGGDTDTIAATTGAILGASAPHLLLVGLADRVPERSDLRPEPVRDALLMLRGGGRCRRDAPE